ncbi:MAG: hypothetical protein FJX03_01050 [Alphaproteobacteria bacterium]|nr:hypothetical protein [Alphaproteobacteria bacterium]
MKKIIVIGVVASNLLCGCSLFPSPGEPVKKYTLVAEGNESVTPLTSYATRPYQLAIDMPTLYKPIDTTRIAVKPQEQTIDYFADVEWADRLNVLIQESLIYSLQNKKAFRGVSRPREGIHADYTLKIEVRKFYIDQQLAPHPSTAKVDYMVYLVKMPERQIVASRQFIYDQAILDYTMDNIIKSLNAAHLEGSKALMSWILQHIRS